MPTKLLGFIGKSGSGKDTAAMHVAQRYGFTHVSASDYLRAYCRENNLPWRSRSEITDSADKIRQKNGPTFIVKQAFSSVDAESVVISGIYSYEEAKCIASKGHIVRLCAPTSKRYSHITKRDQERDRNLTYTEFKLQSAAEVEQSRSHGQRPLSTFKASWSINNNGTLSDLYLEIDDIMSQLQ